MYRITSPPANSHELYANTFDIGTIAGHVRPRSSNPHFGNATLTAAVG